MLLNDYGRNQIWVFEEFLGDYGAQLTGSSIARKKGLNQKSVSSCLKRLEKEHILKSRTEGKNKLYLLNLENREVVKNFIAAAEHLRAIRFYEKNPVVREIAEKISPHIKGMALVFGSYAKGNQKRDSDLDIMVIGKADEKEIDTVSKTYGVEISLKIYPEFRKDILTEEAIKNHIAIKNAEQLVEAMMDG